MPEVARVEVPEWGGFALLRPLSARDRVAIDGREPHWAHVVALSLCDEAGDPLFSPDDVPGLLRKGARPLLRLLGPALRLAGLARGSLSGRIGAMRRSPSLRYAHELAERWGRSVDEVLDALDSGGAGSAAMTDWQAFDSVHTSEAWYRTAALRWDVIHSFGKPKRPIKFEDLLPRRAAPKPTADEIRATVDAAIAAFTQLAPRYKPKD